MCIFGRGSTPPPPQLPPPPPPPLPPTPPLDPPTPIEKKVDPQVRRARKDRGNKKKSQYSEGTGSLRIKLNPKVNTYNMGNRSGGIN
jgi:hypothetical protein